MRICVPLFCLFMKLAVLGAAPFGLTDSDPSSPDFQRRFLASYGVNAAIEPTLASSDRPLYQRVAPLLEAQPRQAIEIVRREVNSGSNAAFDFLLGNLYYQVGDFANAGMTLKQAIKKFPSFRRAHRTLALVAVQQSNFKNAIASLLQVITLGGGDAQSYGLLGYAYLVEAHYESALSAYRMARMFKPDSFDFRRGQAHCLLQSGQHELAVALFDELIAEAPDQLEFWLLQANAFLGLKLPDQAIANLEIVAGSGEGDWKSLTLLGDLYLSDGIPHLALQRYQQAVRQGRPSDWEQMLRPLENLVVRRHYTEAKTLAEDLVRGGRPAEGTAGARRLSLVEAEIAMKSGEADTAIQVLQTALRADPLDAEVLLLMAEYFHRENDLDQAETHLERALSIPDYRREALIALGRVSVTRRSFRAAAEYLRQAQSIESTANVAQYLEAVQDRVKAGRD